MGLLSAPETFQIEINHIFYDCIDAFMVLKLDDLLISIEDDGSHYLHLDFFFAR